MAVIATSPRTGLARLWTGRRIAAHAPVDGAYGGRNGRQKRLSVLRGWLRPESFREKRRAGSGRGRYRKPDLARPALPERLRHALARAESHARIQGKVPAPVRLKLGRAF